MDNKNLQAILRKLQAYKQNPDLVREPTLAELTSLVTLVLDQVNVIQDAINTKKLDIEQTIKGNSDKILSDIEKQQRQAEKATKELLRSVQAEITALSKAEREKVDAAIRALKQPQDGKDAEITEEVIAEVAKLASELVELPDLSKEAETAINASPEAVRNALELLQNNDRLSMSAINGLTDALQQLQSSIARQSKVGGGLGYGQVLKLIQQNTQQITVSATAPSSPSVNDLWVDIS